MTDLELMVRMIEELAKLNAPIVFKGAVVLKFALPGDLFPMTRETMDIDGDWVGSVPSMNFFDRCFR